MDQFCVELEGKIGNSFFEIANFGIFLLDLPFFLYFLIN